MKLTRKKLMDELEQEWNFSKGHYNNVEEYLKDLENSGDNLSDLINIKK